MPGTASTTGSPTDAGDPVPGAADGLASLRVLQRRRAAGLLVLVVFLAGAVGASLAVGTRAIPVVDVWSALVDPGGSEHDVIVGELRLPRTLLALVVGAALGAAGAVIQGHTRNPLADPGLLGVSAGAAFGVVTAISGFGAGSAVGHVWFGFLGALVASVVVFGMGPAGAADRPRWCSRWRVRR